MKDYEYYNIMIRLVIPDCTEKEYDWASTVGTKAYNKYVKLANGGLIKLFNKYWDIRHPETKGKHIDEEMYDKAFLKMSNLFVKTLIFLYGGVKKDKVVRVSILYDIKPTETENKYVCDNMISIERKKLG